MIKVFTKEYKEGDLVVKTIDISLLWIPIFRYKRTTANNKIKEMFATTTSKSNKIKGFV